MLIEIESLNVFNVSKPERFISKWAGVRLTSLLPLSDL